MYPGNGVLQILKIIKKHMGIILFALKKRYVPEGAHGLLIFKEVKLVSNNVRVVFLIYLAMKKVLLLI